MSISEPQNNTGRRLSTADLAAAGRQDMSRGTEDDSVPSEIEPGDRPTPVETAATESTAVEQTAVKQAVAGSPDVAERRSAGTARPAEVLEPLFSSDLAESYRGQWTSIQSGFVDDPRQAVRNGDELVAQMMTNLANTFAEERSRVEAQLDGTGEGATEDLRVALRRYRSFFERLLSL